MTSNKVDSLGVPTFNVSMVFYMLWDDAMSQTSFPGSDHIQRFYCVLHASSGCQVTKLIPYECARSVFLLHSTRFEKDVG
jgi:hypothetical protein